MDVFREYKPIRNKINLLSIEEALGVIWAYGQYLQIDNFNFPKEIEVINEFLQLDVPQRWVSEWELELLAKEVIINGRSAAKKGRALRKWKNLSDIINSIKGFEGARLQSRQFLADARNTGADQGLVADEPEGEADQDRREGRSSRTLCRLPDGGSRHRTANVPGNIAAHR
jgi:hypothetical protein